MPCALRARQRLARRPGAGTESDDGDVALALDLGPGVAVFVAAELALALVELRAVVGRLARRDAALVVLQAVGRVRRVAGVPGIAIGETPRLGQRIAAVALVAGLAARSARP